MGVDRIVVLSREVNVVALELQESEDGKSVRLVARSAGRASSLIGTLSAAGLTRSKSAQVSGFPCEKDGRIKLCGEGN